MIIIMNVEIWPIHKKDVTITVECQCNIENVKIDENVGKNVKNEISAQSLLLSVILPKMNKSVI